MHERISVTVALNVTVDPRSWYGQFQADPGTDIPDRMLAHLRTLPGMQATDSTVELRRLLRQGNRHCRQPAQHRCVGGPSLHPLAAGNFVPPWRDRAGRLLRRYRQLSTMLRRTYHTMATFDRRIPSRPSADFL